MAEREKESERENERERERKLQKYFSTKIIGAYQKIINT